MNTLIEEYLQKLATARAELLRVFEATEQKDHAPEGKWTAQQILTHLYLSENGIARIFRSAERVCQHHPPLSDEQLADERRHMAEQFLDRSIKLTAPERITPVEAMADSEQQLKASRQMLLDCSAELSDEQLRSLSFPHPLRGDISLYGWLWFVAHHEMRHTEQLQELGH